ncbi:ABC transporter substrate-binding protein [Halorarius litoreus]|uniref:ABC transporter substrate-binding protein n=1 Tax=Halorarius litoreus TaxID=2962676 RepID=UPI0020CB9913|nr:ABC transporter substrate-binding protein [Halorarius litoreus]
MAGIAGLAGCTGGGGDGGDGGGGDGGDGGGGDGGDGGGGGTTDIKFIAPGYSGVFSDDIVPMFNEDVSGVEANTQTTTAESSSTRKYFVNQFVSQSSDFDNGMMDVIWPAEFAQNEWIEPIADPENRTDAMLETPVDAATVDGTLVGMPLFTDANGFYYRSDKLEEYGYDEPPSTYMEVVEIAQDILEQDDEIQNGYIWQGGPNEGLTIMWLNWLWGMGGSVQKDGKLVVNSKKGVEALTHARDLITKYDVTPDSVPASSTDQNRQTFQQGKTLFMRNWPYAVGLMDADDSPVQGKFDVTTMPKQEGHPDANNSCLGGWNIFINRYSGNKEAAQRFASYMASEKVQTRLAVEHNYLPVRKSVYNEENYEKNPQLKTFKDITAQTSARPSTPKYTTFSSILFTEANKALVGDKSPQKALDDAQSKIDSEVNNA